MDQAAFLDRVLTGMGFNRQPAPLPVVRIDPNVRVNGNQTIVEPADVTRPEARDLVIGQRVMVWEAESGLHGYGTLADFDEDKQLFFVDVDWSSLKLEDLSSPLEP
ncbi:hypothetical protein ACFWYW_59310 [Nonomuraea sp. NPDC059023]|uniref:hypothetical protein n=1 Tax=unclassified Nonomuraea TaxID=2593643 RepID=UPI003679EFD4